MAHLHGGELTEGAIDDMVRHSITKMSHLHFVAAEEYKQRVIQLGEDRKTVLMWVHSVLMLLNTWSYCRRPT